MKTVSNIAVSNLKYAKSRSLLTGLAIFLTTVLLMVLGTAGVYVIKVNQDNATYLYGDYQGGYARLDKEETETLRRHIQLGKVGVMANLAYMEKEEAFATFTYWDENSMEFMHMKLVEGRQPERGHEIILDKDLAHILGYDGQLGSTISLDYRINDATPVQTGEFTVVGLVNFRGDGNAADSFQIYTSEDFADEVALVDDFTYNVLVQVPNYKELGKAGTTDLLQEIGRSLGIKEDYVVVNNGFLNFATDAGTSTILVCAAIALLVLIFGIFVIYSIFYIGMVNKIREFGTLRALGITKKQLKGVILREGLFLGLVGIPAGVIVGFILALVGTKTLILGNMSSLEVQTPVFNLPVTLIVIVAAVLSIYLAAKRPMKVASSVSPVEAMRYQGMPEKAKKSKKHVKKKLVKKDMNLKGLIVSNMKKNKKQTILTLISISFSSILFVALSSVLSNLNPENAARKELPKGDFGLYLDYAKNDKVYQNNNLNMIQANGVINEDFINEIINTDGVKEIEVRHRALAKTDHHGFEEDGYMLDISGYIREDYEGLAASVLEGTLDYEKAVANNEAVFAVYAMMDWLYGLSVGDTVKMEIYDGEKIIPIELTIQAAINNYQEGSFIIPEEVLSKYVTDVNTISDIFIYAENGKKEQVETSLELLSGRDGHLELRKFGELLADQKKTVAIFQYPIYGLLGIITFIGFMNLANTLITSVVTRKRELGILQAIGLSNKQMSSMLKAEGMMYTIGTLIAAMTIGNLLGFGVYKVCKGIGIVLVGTYSLPVMECLVLAGALIIMQVVLSAVITKSVQKDSLIERIRYQG